MISHLFHIQAWDSTIVAKWSSCPPSPEADHIGVSKSGFCWIIPTISSSIFAHAKAMALVMACGGAKHHRANPPSLIRTNSLYEGSFLFSAPSSFLLKKSEIYLLNWYHRTLARIQSLPLNTAPTALYFFSGSLPAQAVLESKILSLFGMISRLHSSYMLYRQVLYSLHPFVYSFWFLMVHHQQ